MAYGLSLLTLLSYLIAEEQKINPCSTILQHVAIAVLIITANNFLGEQITNIFNMI